MNEHGKEKGDLMSEMEEATPPEIAHEMVSKTQQALVGQMGDFWKGNSAEQAIASASRASDGANAGDKTKVLWGYELSNELAASLDFARSRIGTLMGNFVARILPRVFCHGMKIDDIKFGKCMRTDTADQRMYTFLPTRGMYMDVSDASKRADSWSRAALSGTHRAEVLTAPPSQSSVLAYTPLRVLCRMSGQVIPKKI